MTLGQINLSLWLLKLRVLTHACLRTVFWNVTKRRVKYVCGLRLTINDLQGRTGTQEQLGKV